MDFVFGSA
jgi:hypothetical protein